VAAWSKARSFDCSGSEIMSSGPTWSMHDRIFLFALRREGTDLVMSCSSIPNPRSPTECLRDSYFLELVLKWDKQYSPIHKMLINVTRKILVLEIFNDMILKKKNSLSKSGSLDFLHMM
jgi:hypothetical protein